ncbi:hypothetical protein WDZ17_15175 [Pseudokineococcus basanitobsidens]|uniref:DUF2975 family protein n=1 Tax=Pseudokineococcus basanitobsidens TaxID=1926649 RepID=A0ABU8RNU6_9ACTN
MSREHLVLARVAVVACAAGALTAQLVVPQVAAGYAARYPEVAGLERPYVVAVVVATAAVEVALVAAWQLLGRDGEPGSPRRGRRRVEVVAGSLCLTAGVLAAVCVHAGAVAHVGGPAAGAGLLACLALVVAAVGARRRGLAVVADGYRLGP